MSSFDTFEVVKLSKGWHHQRVRIEQTDSVVHYVKRLSGHKGPYDTELCAWKAAIAMLVSDDLSPEKAVVNDVIDAYRRGLDKGCTDDVQKDADAVVRKYGDQRVTQAMSEARQRFDGEHWNPCCRDAVCCMFGIIEVPEGGVSVETDKEYERRGAEAFNKFVRGTVGDVTAGAYVFGRKAWMAAWVVAQKGSAV